MMTTPLAKLSYFGKVPSRGDFIKSSDQLALLQVIDQWISDSMQALVQDPRWKVYYDAMRAIHFVFVQMEGAHLVAGHLISSHDSAERRFPFVLLSALELNAAPPLVTACPMMLQPIWSQLMMQANRLRSMSDIEDSSRPLMLEPLTIPNEAQCTAGLEEYLHIQTMGGLQRLLTDSGFQGDLRQAMIALGSLLQPIAHVNDVEATKSIILPLPRESMHRDLVASFWMRLMTPFFAHQSLELSVMLSEFDYPVLVLGFSGASPEQLMAMVSPVMRTQHCISVEDSEWVETLIEEEFGVNKLSMYLQQSELSLSSACAFFDETFLGI